MSRKLTYLEKNQIRLLKIRKDSLISEFIGACEEINDQIKEVRTGKWLERHIELKKQDEAEKKPE